MLLAFIVELAAHRTQHESNLQQQLCWIREAAAAQRVARVNTFESQCQVFVSAAVRVASYIYQEHEAFSPWATTI